MTSYFCKLQCNEKDFFLVSNKCEQSLELQLTDTVHAWKGSVSHEELSSKGEDAGITDCEDQTREALSEGANSPGFEFELKSNKNGSLQLIWKKVIEKDCIKFQLGTVTMEPCENIGTLLSGMFECLLETSQSLRQQVTALKKERDRFYDERNTALEMLDNCASVKDDTEQDLYGKFVVILNEKKAKIRELKSQLGDSHDNSPGHDNVQSSDAGKSHKQAAGDVDSDDEFSGKHHHVDDCVTVTSSKYAEDNRRNRTVSEGSSPLNIQIDDSASNDDEELPVAKRKKPATVSTKSSDTSDGKDKPSKKDERDPRIPYVTSLTGTTNTPTTSSDRLRNREKSSSGSKKDAQESKPGTSSGKEKTASPPAKSSNVDDLIDDMA
jgi:DNA-repair protein XRCC4